MKSSRVTFAIVMKYVGIGMALIYVVVGILVLSGSETFFQIPKPYITPIGLALVGYGLFRGYRLYTKYNREES
jgi:hypothetical protein